MKRFISSILVCLLLLSTLCVGAFAQSFTFDDSFTLGDVNEDGGFNAKDIFRLKSVIAKTDDSEISISAADIDADGKASSRDVFYMKTCVVKAAEMSDFDSDRQVDVFKIGGIDISEFCILLPEDADYGENISFAAEQMQKYTEIATGVTLPVSYGTPAKDHSIIYHRVEMESELGKELGFEGYKVRFAGGNLNIYGTYRGNMYCTYDILEDYLGFVFYSNEKTFVREQRAVLIPEDYDKTFIPEVGFRMVVHTFGSGGIESHFLPMKINGTQLYQHECDYRYGTLTGPHFINAHSFGYYWKMATGYQKQQHSGGYTEAEIRQDLHSNAYDHGVDMEAEHASDWGAKEPWQPCPSDPEHYDNEFEGLVETMEMIQKWGSHTFQETNSIMSFSPIDNIGGLCHCRICNAKVNGGTIRATKAILADAERYGGKYTISGNQISYVKERYSGLYLDFINKAAYDISHEEKKYYQNIHTDDEGEVYSVDLGDMQVYYPNMKLMSITYDLYAPETVKPEGNLVIVFCGQGCFQHPMGTEGCGDYVTTVTNTYYTRSYTNAGPDGTNAAMKKWAEMLHEVGSELWFWYYPTTLRFQMAPTPNVTNIYYDLYWLISEVGIDGIYYEGGGQNYTFETLKAYIGSYVMYRGAVSEDEIQKVCKEYLYIYFGKGYEEIYEYLMMHTAAGDASGCCYINNYSWPDLMYSFDYLCSHFEEMRGLILTAMEKTDDREQTEHLEKLLITCETVGLQSVHESWYKNGGAVQKYKDIYDEYISLINKYKPSFGYNDSPEAGNYDTCVFDQVHYWA